MTTTQLPDGSGGDRASQGQATGSATQANGAAADPFSGLQDAGIREWVGKAGFKDTSVSSFESLAKKARDAESLIGRSIQLPADDAKPEDVDKFLSRATEKYRPKDADGYEFKLPGDVPKDMPYDADAAKEFKGVAHELGLTAAQAQKAHDWFVKRQAGAFTATAEKLTKTAGDATTALEKAFGGAQGSDPFKAGVELADRGVTEVSKAAKLADGELMAALKDANLIGPGNIILSAPIARAFAEVGKLYAEDRLIDGKTTDPSNPYQAGRENVTEQMRIAKADPEKARRLIQAAGRQADFPQFFRPQA